MTDNKPVSARVTVKLSKPSVVAINATQERTDETKTSIINKSVQLFGDIVEA